MVAPDRDAPDRTSGRRVRALAIVAVFVGLVAVVFANQISEVLVALLPGRATIPSSGTGMGSLGDEGPTIVRRSGAVIVVAAIVGLGAGRWVSSPGMWTERRGRLALGVVVAATMLWYGWLAAPHNGFSTNARFHWVDYLTWDSDRFTYAAGRIPHLLLYDSPHVWQAINIGVLAVLLYAIGRQLGYSTWLSAGLAAVPAISGNLLLFATAAEDVVLNTTLLLAVVLVSLRRQPVLLGLTIGSAVLGRPSFMVLIGCVAVAEIARGLRSKERGIEWRYTAVATGVAAATVVASQVVFAILGDRYLFVGGQIVRSDALDQWVPRAVDGFTVSPFSGVYGLHLLWVMPLATLAGAVIAVVTARGQTSQVASTIYLSCCFVVAHVLVHEARPLAYYNTRYLAYTFPFLFFMAVSLLAHRRFPSHPAARPVAIVLLVLGTAVVPADPVGAKQWVESRAEVELWAARDELRDLADGRFVFLNFGDVLSRNYVAYVLRRDVATIQLVGDPSGELVRPDLPSGRGDDIGSGTVVISHRSDPWTNESPVLEVGDFIVDVIG